ncbi:hypothetical protein DLE01_03530, partial [Streptomyces sp. FT05W]
DLAFDGWSVNPDPDFVMSIHTCAALPAKAKESAATDNWRTGPGPGAMTSAGTPDVSNRSSEDAVRRRQPRATGRRAAPLRVS